MTPPELTPVPVNARRIVLIGIALFAVAAVVLATQWTRLGHDGHRDWLWTCLAGVGFGSLGYAVMVRHRGMGRTV